MLPVPDWTMVKAGEEDSAVIFWAPEKTWAPSTEISPLMIRFPWTKASSSTSSSPLIFALSLLISKISSPWARKRTPLSEEILRLLFSSTKISFPSLRVIFPFTPRPPKN